MSVIKLICIDLDGTLLNDEKKVSETDRCTIQHARTKGINVTIFTGRNYYAALPYVQELGIEIPVVFQNGALIATPSVNKIFRMITLDSKIAMETIRLSKKYGLFPVVYESFFSRQDMLLENDYYGVFESYFKFNQSRIKKIDRLESFLLTTKSIAEVAIVGKDILIENLTRDLLKNSDGFTLVKNQQIDSEVFMEVFGKDVGKEIALDFLLHLFNIDISEVAYIGDNYNDLKIMQKVGFPIAMQNAPQDVKDVAKFVTLSNNDSGVSLAIERVMEAMK
ncbi:MAG: Cof-type HAD-IIB family hydrolase [Pseudothermotoga sp.]